MITSRRRAGVRHPQPWRTLAACLVVGALGCGDEEPTNTSADAGTQPSVDSGAGELFASCVSTGPEVDACVTQATEVLRRCTSSSRQCSFGSLRSYCGCGDPATVQEVTRCLSLADGCQTPFDPSGADPCLETGTGPALASDPDRRAIATRAGALCTESWQTLGFRVYAAVVPSPAELLSCAESAQDCTALFGCLDPFIGIPGC